jgi:hypothetical protein
MESIGFIDLNSKKSIYHMPALQPVLGEIVSMKTPAP